MRAFFAAFMLLSCVALAQVPQNLNYQGRLLKSDGTPESGFLDVTFGLYADATTPTALWTETQEKVALTDGYYSVTLGAVTAVPSSIFDGSVRYLQLTIGSQVLSPRQLIASVPYAHMAGVAKSLQAGDVSYIQNQASAPQPGAFKIIGAAASAGTGTVSSSGTDVVGSGTDFTSLRVGDELLVGPQTRLVTAVLSATSLTVNQPFSPALTASVFSFRKPVAQIQDSAGKTGLVLNSRAEMGIGTATPAAKLDVQSTTQGFLPPRMTTAQRDAIAGPAAGLMLFNTTTSEMNFYDGSKWRSMVSGFSVRRANTALQSDITIHQVTPTWNYAVANLPANTKALIVGIYYLHGSTVAGSHGYLSFWAYQRGKAADSPDSAKFEAFHHNWYYNSDYSELIVPWDKALNDDALEVRVISSYNDNTANKYEIRFAGYITAN